MQCGRGSPLGGACSLSCQSPPCPPQCRHCSYIHRSYLRRVLTCLPRCCKYFAVTVVLWVKVSELEAGGGSGGAASPRPPLLHPSDAAASENEYEGKAKVENKIRTLSSLL